MEEIKMDEWTFRELQIMKEDIATIKAILIKKFPELENKEEQEVYKPE